MAQYHGKPPTEHGHEQSHGSGHLQPPHQSGPPPLPPHHGGSPPHHGGSPPHHGGAQKPIGPGSNGGYSQHG